MVDWISVETSRMMLMCRKVVGRFEKNSDSSNGDMMELLIPPSWQKAIMHTFRTP
jgi:hypothetical protein